MSESDGQEHHGEIIVVHRHGDHEDGHHGGAWKIAFADFMTAMMAFFLVMWLINSTDDQTLSQVATYFSPIKLNDREAIDRGIHDNKNGGAGNEKEKTEEKKKKEGKSHVEPLHDPGERRFPEEELFSDPYDKLAKLAMQATRNPPRPGGGLKKEGHAGGDAFRDPFDPEFRSNTDEGPVAGADAKLKSGSAVQKSGQGTAAKDPEIRPNPEANAQPGPEMAVNPSKRGKMDVRDGDAFGESHNNTGQPGQVKDTNRVENHLAGQRREPKHERLVSAEEGLSGEGELPAKGDLSNKGQKGDARDGENAERGRGDNANKGESISKGDKPERLASGVAPEVGDAPEKGIAPEKHEYKEGQAEPKSGEAKQEPSEAPQGDSKDVRRLLAINESARRVEREFVQSVYQSNLAAIPDITVTGTPEGVLISLTDKVNFEMFAIASAEPRPELVVVMEKLGKVLLEQKGDIVIRGHTDSRPYRSKMYDNWRLSTSRAHMAYFMLVRAGVPKYRVERIEGYADRSPRNPKKPRAAENRRIEILLRPAKS